MKEIKKKIKNYNVKIVVFGKTQFLKCNKKAPLKKRDF